MEVVRKVRAGRVRVGANSLVFVLRFVARLWVGVVVEDIVRCERVLRRDKRGNWRGTRE